MAPGRPWAADSAWVAAVFFVLALVAVHMAHTPSAITNVWFANAAAMAVLATSQRRRWPLMVLAIAGANVAANQLIRGNWLLSCSFVPGNLVEVLAGAWLLQRLDLARRFDDGPTELARTLVVAGLLPQLLGASIGAAVLKIYGFASFEGAWLGWYADSTLGAVAVLPLALALRKHQLAGTPAGVLKTRPLLFALLSVAVVFVAFHYLPTPFELAALPLVASVFFVAPAATYGLCFLLVLTLCAGLDYGWLQAVHGTQPWSNLMLYLPAAAAVLPAQFLALVVARMRQLQADTDALTLVGADSIAVFDRQGIFRGVNRAFERSFGRERRWLLGRSIEDELGSTYGGSARQQFETARQGEVVKLRVDSNAALGARVLDLQYLPVPDADGSISRVLVSAHDVTDLMAVQRELESTVQRLRSANEGLQQFVRMASHDMREPLNTIAQFCGLVSSEHAQELSAPARLYFGHISSGALRMRCLLDDVLSFARLEEGSRIEESDIALPEVFDSVLAALGARIAQSQAQIERSADLHSVRGSESLLVLLFQNLVSNAVKFVPLGRAPRVRISSRVDGDEIVVTVADNGIGISASGQAELFQPFKRLHTRRQYDGTGLGLTICKRIAEAMGGSIELSSVVDVGTQVHVRLRRYAIAAQRIDKALVAAPSA